MRLVFVCIGTPKIFGDSLRPRVGSFLKELGYIVYGTIQEPITSLNIQYFQKQIKDCHKDDLIIGIDAAFGDAKDIGKIKIVLNGIRPGGAYTKQNDKIGDIGILAIVADKNKERKNALNYIENDTFEKLLRKVVKICRHTKVAFNEKIAKNTELS